MQALPQTEKLDGVAVAHPVLYVTRRITHLQHTLIARVTIGINLRRQVWPTGKEITLCHNHTFSLWRESLEKFISAYLGNPL